MTKLLKEIKKYNNWNDLKLNLIDASLNTKEKGDIFELITKYYLLINPIYQTQLKEVWLAKEVPRKVRKYLNLSDNDEGIDIIAQTKDDKYWAIQCKYLANEDSSITGKYIASFLDLAGNVCKNITLKLTTTTANRKSYKFDKKYDNSVTFLLGDIWKNLNYDNFFLPLTKLVNDKFVKLEPYLPRDHQIRAIQNAYMHFCEEKNSRGKLISPCGSGKSLTAYWISKRLQSKMILVAVPSLALIKQTLEVWTREIIANDDEVKWIVVCSDDTVSADQKDSLVSTTKDLGFETTTDVEYIANWLENSKDNTSIVFVTYQSGKTISEASRKANITYDLGIMDEAHKTAGVKGKPFSYLLFNKNISIQKRLFMTATERRYSGSNDEIVSMDDVDLYGEDFEVLTFKEALEIRPPILCDYKIIVMMVTKKEIADLIIKNKYIRLDNEGDRDEIESNMLASTIAMHKAIKKYNIKHIVSFHNSIKRSKLFMKFEGDFRKSLTEYTSLDAFHVSGKTSVGKRKQIINDFAESEKSLITNARCLTEGVDVPKIDCVLFADPKQSTIDIVQAVGRALRTSDGKEFGYVLVPILIDDDNTDIENIKSKSYDAILSILRALASSDERIIDYFQTTDKGRVFGGRGLINIESTVGLDIDMAEFTNAIKLSILQKIKKVKWRPFEEAREFARNLELKNGKEWTLYCKNKLKSKDPKPNDIPSNPGLSYKLNGWKGIQDWLGTSSILRYRPYEEARVFARNLGLKNQKEWREYCKGNIPHLPPLPYDIPEYPKKRYRGKNGFTSWKSWLSSGVRPFEKAKDFVKTLNLSSYKEWNAYCKGKIPYLPTKPYDIPRDPDLRYNNWNGWSDWLTGEKGRVQGEYREFKKAREFVRALHLKGQAEWKLYYQGKLKGHEPIPDDIPTVPENTYKLNGWKGIADWLGYEGKKKPKRGAKLEDNWMPFEQAREFARSLGLANSKEWKMYAKGELEGHEKKPDNIPQQPSLTYPQYGVEWISWGDWLGYEKGKTKVKNALSFEEARNFVRKLGLKNTYAWEDYKKGKLEYLPKIPNNIPRSPANFYKNKGWAGMHDWLGINVEK